MRIIISSLLPLIPSIVLAAPLTFNFSGTTGAGDVKGSFSYETVQGPTALNVRGLVGGNATYQLSSWQFQADSNVAAIPSTTFSNSLPGNTVEFCQGKCIFGSGPIFTLLTFTNGVQRLQLGFDLADTTPLTTPPANPNEWGAYNLQASQFRTNDTLALATSGSLSAAVPEPAISLLWVGLLAIVFLHRTKMIA